jgi:cell division protein FtsB
MRTLGQWLLSSIRLTGLMALGLILPLGSAETMTQTAGQPEAARPSISVTQPVQPSQPLKSDNPVQSLPLSEPELNLPPLPPSGKVNLIPDEKDLQIPLIPIRGVPFPRFADFDGSSTSRTEIDPTEDATMFRTRFSMFAGSLALAVACSSGGIAADPTPAELARQIADLQDSMKSLTRTVDTLSRQVDQKDAIDRLARQLDEMSRKMETLQRDVADMKSTRSSTSLRVDPSAVTLKSGRVRFVNDYPDDVTVVLNDRTYRMLPGTDLTLTVPAGAFRYQVLQLQSSIQNRTLADNETKEIRIHVAR